MVDTFLADTTACSQTRTGPTGSSLGSDGLTPTAIRFVGHLPYFKIGSALMLPEALGLGGVIATTLAYAAVCLLLSRFLLAKPLAGTFRPLIIATLLLLATMLLVGPAIAIIASGQVFGAGALATAGLRFHHLFLPYLGLLLPVCGSFLAAQLLTRPGSPFKL